MTDDATPTSPGGPPTRPGPPPLPSATPPPFSHEPGQPWQAAPGAPAPSPAPGSSGGQAPPPGWWLASDGNWYPPQPQQQPSYQGYGYGYATPQTNGMAIASLILGIIWIYWIGSVLALIFGYTARKQIDQSQGRQTGRGMAIAGIVLGWIGLAFAALFFVLVVVVAAFGEETSSRFGDDGFTFGNDVDVPALQSSCIRGDMFDCDELYFGTRVGSEAERVAQTCGNRLARPEATGDCVERFD